MTRTQPLGVLAGGVAVLFALTGCSFNIGTPTAVDDDTIAVSELAALAEKRIFDDFGAEVDIDCGSSEVPFEVGTVVECTGVEVGDDQVIPVTLEIVLVDDDYYEIDITTGEPVATTGGDGTEVFVPAADFEDTVATALESVLGERVAPQCGRADVEIVVGSQMICAVVMSSGFGEALVTITSFDGSTYEITAELIED